MAFKNEYKMTTISRSVQNLVKKYVNVVHAFVAYFQKRCLVLKNLHTLFWRHPLASNQHSATLFQSLLVNFLLSSATTTIKR